ncbi:Sodium/hydrogen exchanger family-domain-containing protein [Fusarium oxysporum Fo47]|uniref:Cation/H+ exchanger transmembrane domain-containing protein n=1 Tax=Fusarium oxysporum Fo47 TaxID=660027 RepID=W9JAG1_FUSOX|nr:Sodium/hydrogen exchanger family-domain-containing protein [Fusarium oxysporum Fo47]EWZ29047.1 hypothetical protein FOZG_17336 [Fusarium oxysporum Fo47]QKD57486.1 Sodium/hydrogen exchanger family-domain-containing protein [Fusarium oxysporum Fo47]
MATAKTSLPYHEPGIVTILIQTSFVLLLNVVNFLLDRTLYCGLLGQVFLGVAWGTPGAKWLTVEAEEVIVQLGYLGLLLLVYEGGLSTSFQALKANLLLSSFVAITGIALPMGISFVLLELTGATPLQSFAAGAALCSTSLGTTFTVLGSSGLIKSRLGVVLTSAAMMDDVVGLVMVQIISNLGGSSSSISAVTIIRPLLVSAAFAICAPVACLLISKPFTLWLNEHRTKQPSGVANRILTRSSSIWVIHTSILIGCVASSSYAGTSNLFAAYIAGASISWWDTEVPHPTLNRLVSEETSPPSQNTGDRDGGETRDTVSPTDSESESRPTPSESELRSTPSSTPLFSGAQIYNSYFMQPLEKVLRPFFFASIGFSIPITEMFRGPIVWKGFVYAILMLVGKLFCGLWLIRFSIPRLPIRFPLISKLSNLRVKNCASKVREKQTPPCNESAESSSSQPVSPPTTSPSPNTDYSTTRSQIITPHSEPAGSKPRSIYPASIIGCAMAARGEIGFLISSIAESKGVFSTSSDDSGQSSDIFLVVTWAIVLCTIIGPLAVGLLVRRVKQLQRGVERQDRIVRSDVLGVWGVS